MTKPWQLQVLEFDLRLPQTKESWVQLSLSGAPGRSSLKIPSIPRAVGKAGRRKSVNIHQNAFPLHLWKVGGIAQIFQEVPEVFNSR